MYACPHCNSTKMFLAFKDGILVKVLEDHTDVDGLDTVQELLCSSCNRWFPNPGSGQDGARILSGELVTITGLKGTGTIKVVATGIVFPFHYETFEDEAMSVLLEQDVEMLAALREFSSHRDNQLAIRVKEQDNPNTWVYRINGRKMWRSIAKKITFPSS
jgi:uncharacterized protein YbaR (Trm112 family)